MKSYDRDYFEKWYRNASTRVITRKDLQRKVALAVAVAEHFLRREIETVLDIGCGEAPWSLELRKTRPRIEYTGLDPSEYVVKRFGKRRNISQATFGELSSLELEPEYDLVICSDVLHYVPDEQIESEIFTLARLTGSIAFLEVLTAEDEIVGDLDGLIRRPSSWYRERFRKAGLSFAAPHCWLSPEMRDETSPLEAELFFPER